MAHKIVDITRSANSYDILSQTPKNYDKNNYFLKELQHKVNAEWKYRPNRVDLEYEATWGKEDFKPMEVVMQSVKSEKGTDISDDFRNIVFQNILEDRFHIGSKFRFGTDYNLNALQNKKNTWLVVNANTASMTASCVVQRCNGTLGSVYKDEQGVSHYHYEPVIQDKGLSSVNLFYNETAVSPQSELLIIAQHNEFTKNYFINQRFVIGYDKIYRVKAINKFYSNSTYDPYDVGLMRIYLEITESCIYDDFEKRIAYQNDSEIYISHDKNDSSYQLQFTTPEYIPVNLPTEPLLFTAVIKKDDGTEYIKPVTVESNLENLPDGIDPNIYYSCEVEDNTFTLKRNRVYVNGDLHIKCIIEAQDSPSGEELSFSFDMVMDTVD